MQEKNSGKPNSSGVVWRLVGVGAAVFCPFALKFGVHHTERYFDTISQSQEYTPPARTLSGFEDQNASNNNPLSSSPSMHETSSGREWQDACGGLVVGIASGVGGVYLLKRRT